MLELFLEYKVPVIFETKTTWVGLKSYLDLIKKLKCAIIVSIMGGSDTLNYKLEPNAPVTSTRWHLVHELGKLGLWCGVRWEPIMPGINSKDEYLKQYAKDAKKHGAQHVSLYNYRSSNFKMAKQEFESRGFDYIKMLEGNLDEKWKPLGKKFFQFLHQEGVKASSPDFVNFPFDSDKISCCGVDGLFKPYQFTFQYACHLIKTKGSVCWDDMEAVEFKNPESYEKMKKYWNGREGKEGIFTLKDCVGNEGEEGKEIIVVDRKNGKNVYARAGGAFLKRKDGLVF
jgi:hypothetical protein